MKKQSVVGILIHDGKVLLLKRHPHDRTLPDKYCLPGGKLEENENNISGLSREFYEETGIVITQRAFLFDIKSNDKFDIFFYLVNTYNKDVTLSEEHETYAWIDLKDLYIYSDDIAPLTLEVLSKYKQQNGY